MIETPISHPDESVCCQVFDATDWLHTFGQEQWRSGMSNKLKPEAYRVRHVQGVLPSSEACSATGTLAFFLQSRQSRHLCRLKPRDRVDHLSCIGKAFHTSGRFKSYRSGRSRIILRARSVSMTFFLSGNSSCISFAVVRSTLLLLDFSSEYFVLS